MYSWSFYKIWLKSDNFSKGLKKNTKTETLNFLLKSKLVHRKYFALINWFAYWNTDY